MITGIVYLTINTLNNKGYVGQTTTTNKNYLGSGVDGKSYAMEYGKNFGKLHINCGVILDGCPIIEYM